ncbi:hypothetical protein [Sulfitobacter sp. PS-8MA]
MFERLFQIGKAPGAEKVETAVKAHRSAQCDGIAVTFFSVSCPGAR